MPPKAIRRPRRNRRARTRGQRSCRSTNSRMLWRSRRFCSRESSSTEAVLDDLLIKNSPSASRPRISRIRSAGENIRNRSTSSRITSVSLGELNGEVHRSSGSGGRLSYCSRSEAPKSAMIAPRSEFREHAMGAGDGEGAVADGEGDAFGRVAPDVSGGEDSRAGGLDRCRARDPSKGHWPESRGVGPGENEPLGIHRDTLER